MQKRRDYRVVDANEAVADIAYRLSEVIAIYPITPASVMGEHTDSWSADHRNNIWGVLPEVVEMQSEGGAAGAIHGALQTGALVTTFTASQGLLLMIPNLFKIAGELSSFCMHVAARTVATHALSIFGDHSDVMAARSTGMSLLASGSAQEAQDLAAIAHIVTLKARIPILHFFDGFRTSHEITKIIPIDDQTLLSLLDADAILAHRLRALDPDRPVVRGTSQNPDVYFQSREAVEPFYARFPAVIDETMSRFAELTGRRYRLFDYVGHPEAQSVVVLMGSGAECAQEAVEYLLKQGEQVGVLKVRLFRPFSVEHLMQVLPSSLRVVTILDRTKEPGSSGEPLFQEFTSGLVESVARGERTKLPVLISGRYGLASKEFTPAMVKSIFDNMKTDSPKRRFTVGIKDDISDSSLSIDPDFDIESDLVFRALFFGLGADGTVSANKSSIKIIGEKTSLYVQGHFEYDSRKAGTTTISHLRFGPNPIRSTYQIKKAQFIAIHDREILERRDILSAAMIGSTILLNTPLPTKDVWSSFPVEVQEQIVKQKCRLFVIDASDVSEKAGLGRRINTVMQVCFFALSKILPLEEAMDHIRHSIEDTWGRRGPEVIKRNFAAIDAALISLHEINIPENYSSMRFRSPIVAADAPDFVKKVTRLLLEGRGDELPVSAFPPDGTWPCGTGQYEKRALAQNIPIWDPDICVQCNFCSTICPHTAIQTKVFDPSQLSEAPTNFRSMKEGFEPTFDGLNYSVQVAPEDCTGCGLCIEVCPGKDRLNPGRKALVARPLIEHRDTEREAFAFFKTLKSAPLTELPIDKRTAAFREPLFEFCGACAGCGETPYLRLLTQLFGDHLIIANATGCSSIYGGNLPTTPYKKNQDGRGPAWSNSLFEDNAEFGLGMRLGLDKQVERARSLLMLIAERLPPTLVRGLLSGGSSESELSAQRARVIDLEKILHQDKSSEAQALLHVASALTNRTVWIVGGDGWAYDIGYGGLDHVLASNRKVNILVLDTEVYSNTGGQQSKATPLGAAAKFATAGKSTRKKDLGLLAMSYGHVYVAEVAMQARSEQTVQAFLEAEKYPGPSLIIAHSPCIAHGYDLVHSPTHQRMAIESGMWPLYRFDPKRREIGESPLILDSDSPTIDVATYMESEARFKMVQLRSPERYAMLVNASREAVQERRSLYEQLSKIHLRPEIKHV